MDSADALARFKIEAVPPIGKRKVWGHQHVANGPHVWGELELDEYPSSPEGKRLQQVRRELDLSLGDAARRLGVGVSVMSGLEYGAYRGAWAEIERSLRGSSKGGTGHV